MILHVSELAIYIGMIFNWKPGLNVRNWLISHKQYTTCEGMTRG